MMIGVFGGSFDPPHICHALVCHYALATGDLDRVVAIPCFRHPFGKPMAPFADRVTMCQLAMWELGDRVVISEIESRHGGPSYTVETLRALKAERPGDRFRLIVGSDILEETGQWKSFDEIRRMAPLLVVPRGIISAASPSFAFPDLSSTEIRDALRRGGDVSEAVPRRVLEYIRKRGLYGAAGFAPDEPA